MSYQGSLATEHNKNVIKCLGGCMGGCMVVILLVFLVFDIVGLSIGTSHPNATCYASQNIMSLSSWLVLVCSVATAVTVILIFLIIIGLCGFCTDNGGSAILASIPGMILLALSAIFGFIMNIIGIIELAYQFPSCNHEVQSVCVMVIIIVVINTMGFVGSCCGGASGNVNKNSGYTAV